MTDQAGVRYWVRVSLYLLDSEPADWAAVNLRLIERRKDDPDWDWCLFEDANPGVPPELAGKRVELWFESRDGKPAITNRTVIHD
ncbi:MAG TPA: hypothetical protein VGS19_23820 [Streptosporangiaceae bacterium]|nr:hypothetical protein [Streptosporangiaceae bacterium]